MDGVLLFSHGSLLCGAGQALDRHRERLEKRRDVPVAIGYLNYSEPTVEQGVAQLARAGVTRITVVPYFLVPGYFVTTSLPKRLLSVQAQNPQIEFQVADALGVDGLLADALIEVAEQATNDKAEWRGSYDVAAASCRSREDCPLYGTVHCPATRTAASAGSRPLPAVAHLSSSTSSESINLHDDTPTALIVMVHGSPTPTANASVYAVVEHVKARNLFAAVEIGFMECNEPTIAETADRCVALGARRVIAAPYFLHLGTHVADDLPTIIEEASERHPHVEFLMAPYLGLSERVTDLLAERAHLNLTFGATGGR